MSSIPRFSNLVWLGFAAAAAMIVGAFGPWGKVIGLINTSISGTDGTNDGWFVIGAAAVGALTLFGWWRGRGRWLALGPMLAGGVGLAATWVDRGNVSDLENNSGTDLAHIQVGWGLNLALGASLVLAVVGLVALLGNPDAPGMRAAPRPSSAMTVTRECPHCKSAIRPDASVCPYCQRESEPWTLSNDLWWVQRDGEWLWYEVETGDWFSAPDPVAAGQPSGESGETA